MKGGELKFEFEKESFKEYSADGELTYYIYGPVGSGSVEVYLWMEYLDLDEEWSITELGWKLSLRDLDANSASEVLEDVSKPKYRRVPDLEYRVEAVELKEAEDESCFLKKRTIEDRTIDDESGKVEVVKLIKQAPFILLKEDGEKEWFEKFRSVLAKGRTVDRYVDYFLYIGVFEVSLKDDRIVVDKGSERGIIDKEDPQKAKELVELFEKTLAGQVNLQDAAFEALRSLGLGQDFSRRR